ncbi:MULTISPECIES: MerR family transcriptional regulator [unclassified Streptomyces]|uniref:MerR family transcriptional regulator n=1 Tax=unclassified Streptomyces TaxID=2593676 RepID=UPI00343F8259
MRIGVAARAAGLTPRALRHYEQQGLLTPSRTRSGHREYELSDIRRLRTVRELLATGLTIADVRSFTHLLDAASSGAAPDGGPGDGGPVGCVVGEVSLRRLAELDERIERLTALRERLASRIADRFGELFDVPPREPVRDRDRKAQRKADRESGRAA